MQIKAFAPNLGIILNVEPFRVLAHPSPINPEGGRFIVDDEAIELKSRMRS
jgi:hypothetical protein